MRSKPTASERLDGAILAMVSGNLESMERICLEVLAEDPEVAQAHVLLGIASQRKGEALGAVRHLTRAYELKPDSFDAATCLAAAHRISGNAAEATRFAEIAANLRPHDAKAQRELGSIYLETLRLQDAETHLKRATTLSKGELHDQLALNQCLDREGKHQEALRLARQVAQTHGIPTDDLLHFASVMLGQSNPATAIEFSREALRRAPNMLRARAELARALVDAGEASEAAAVLDPDVLSRCLLNDPNDSESMTVIGMAYQSLGQVEVAREWLLRAIGAPSPAGSAYYAYAYSSRMTEEDGDVIAAIEARIQAPKPSDDIVSLHFALGKAYEDRGDYAGAMAQYEAANRCQVAGHAGFDRSVSSDIADKANAMFSKDFLIQNRGHGSGNELPIFVVGMIRSGTTLLEQILSSHPQVGGAGEVPFWTYNVPDLVDLEHLAIRKDRLLETAERYLALLGAAHPGKLRVVDKMPVNFKYLGVLHLALPNARIIHMRRNPADTCMSIYSTHSRALSISGNEKSDLAATYREYLRTMSLWRDLLPADRLLEVDYEDLVQRIEPTIRNLIDFCGLEWDDACLQPEANIRAVSTPSLWQVRRPINSASVARWRRFEPWIPEFKELLPASEPQSTQ